MIPINYYFSNEWLLYYKILIIIRINDIHIIIVAKNSTKQSINQNVSLERHKKISDFADI